METLKILMTTSFYPPYNIGGDAVHVANLAEELADRGHEVHVLFSMDAFTAKVGSKPQIRQTNSKVTIHAISSPLSLSAYSAYTLGVSRTVTKKFRELVTEVEPDVVHHHNISLLGYNVLKKLGSYLNLYTAHDYWLICPNSNLLRRDLSICQSGGCVFCSLPQIRPPQLWRYRSDFVKSVSDIDCLIAPSEFLKNKLQKCFNVKSITIPNFVPSAKPTQLASLSDFVFYAGVLEKHKGVELLVRSYRDMEPDMPKLVIAGRGELASWIEGFVGQEKLSERIIRLGWVERDQLLGFVGKAKALVVPSIWPENSPLIALEALSLGTPVIGSNRGGLPEIVSRLSDSLVFSWEIEGDLNRAIRQIAVDEGSLRKKARTIYERFYTPERYLTAYKSLIDGEPVPGG